MSRWEDAFKSSLASWGKFKGVLGSIPDKEGLSLPEHRDRARIRKVTAHIDAMLRACDPELAPLAIWEVVTNQTNQCTVHITNYSQSGSWEYLQQANENLDTILTRIRPHIIAPGKVANAARAGLLAYNKEVESYILSIRKGCQTLLAELKADQEKSQQSLAEILASEEKIDELCEKFFEGDEDTESVEKSIELLLDEVTKANAEVKKAHEAILIKGPEGPSMSQEITNATVQSKLSSAKLQSLLQSSQDQTDDLEEFYNQIFGAPVVVETDDDDSVKEVRTNGLKEEIEIRRKELTEFQVQQIKVCEELRVRIEDLLPGATSAGMANAYLQLKQSFEAPLKTFHLLFYFSIAALFLSALALAIEDISFWRIDWVTWDGFRGTLLRLPLLAPLIWLAVFSSRRLSQMQRLQQEYAHKEAIAKSYISFKLQIDNLQNADTALPSKLLHVALEAIAFNASSTLDGKHMDKTPAQDVFETAFDKFMLLADKIRPTK